MKTVDDALAFADRAYSKASDAGVLAAEVRRLRNEIDQLRCQLAGCGVAALENTVGSRSSRAVRGDYGYSASYEYVCNAVDREISLREENERLRKDAERGQFLVEHGEWFRHNHDTAHAYALLAVRLPYTADLSCKAMREDAIDAARSAK